MLARGAVKLHSPEQKKWLIVAACHAGTLADNRTPVGSGRVFVQLVEQMFFNPPFQNTLSCEFSTLAALAKRATLMDK